MNHVKAEMLQEQRITLFRLCHSLLKRFTPDPRQFYTQRVPALPVKTTPTQDNAVDSEDVLAFGLVTKALSRNEWVSNPKALEAIQKESEGLRANQTWYDETACDADELMRQSKVLSKEIKVAELLILCGIKHAELDASKQKYTKAELSTEETKS